MEAGDMMEGLYFSWPVLLWLVPLLLILGLIYLRIRGGNRLLAASRLAVFCLIIIAAANPYFVQTHIEQSASPSITILDDRTGSMSIFDPALASRLSQFLTGAQIRSFSGNTTPLGDKVIQYSRPGESLVLVSDGYSNSGTPLADALSFARSANTTVFAIDSRPVRSDAGVEISGANTAVLGGGYPFTVIVRSSDGYQGPLTVLADGMPIYREEISANGTSSIKISQTFTETGPHVLRASIASDLQPANDVYQKAVYVVPKPQVLLLSDSLSPLATVLSDLYKLSIATDLPDDLRPYKAVIVDDQKYSRELDRLTDYVRDGGGLVVVGGDSSYDLGGYNNSSFEKILPVRSVPSRFEGGKTAIIVMDISFSLLSTRTADGTPLLDYEKALAVELLKSPDLQDYNVGLVVFGTKAYHVLDPMPLSKGRSILGERITSLSPSGTENTYLDSGLQLAWDMINESGEKGELIVLSDGNLWNYEDVYKRSIQLLQQMNLTTRLIQVQAFPGRTGLFDQMAAETGADFASFVYPASLTTKVQETAPEKKEQEKPTAGYVVTLVNKNHFITSDLDLNATITGFNDVTPKPGSQRLAAMADGKPVLTAWRYGLGRSASISTDDGSSWAPALYAAPASRLISLTVNWAIGDPRPEAQRVEAEDGWAGTPLQITVNSDARPVLAGASVEKVGERSYILTFTPAEPGIFYIGDYGVAVNYPLEYRYMGFNPELPKLIMAAGGKTFTESEARLSLVAEAGQLSQRTVSERTSQRDLLLLLALIIFIVEIVRRKLRELRRRGRKRA
jgi:uncharacterized membrane protein